MRTLDKNTRASLPAELEITRTTYARFFGQSPRERHALYFKSFLPYSLSHLAAFAPRAAPPWLRVKEHMAHGCLCPCQVVDLQRGLLATFANLNAIGEGSIPRLKITRAPLQLLPSRLRHDGALLACASLYYPGPDGVQIGHWVDFDPLPVDCLVPDAAACDAAREKLSPLAWEALAIALPQIAHVDEGLHTVAVPHEIVWNAWS